MRTCFLFSFIKSVNIKGNGLQLQNFLVIFFPYKNVAPSKNDIQLQLRDYFFRNTLPDKLIIIGFEFNKTEIGDLFSADSEVFNYIPKFEYDKKENNISAISINGNGDLEKIIGNVPQPEFIKELYRRGMVKIFKENGGLIISQSAHHFVFPSGKHCDKFLRTGNVLINGAEILFIASAIILHFKGKTFEDIYCDTSSINSLAYSFISLMRDLKKLENIVHVESFGSYELFEKATFKAKRNSLFLISSSTSGSILKRMASKENKNQNISLDDIAIIYGLNVEATYMNQIICDLSVDIKNNPEGLPPFKSFNIKKEQDCDLCINGSRPIKVAGDVFLLEKPTVLGYRITTADLPVFLRNFGDYYNPGGSQRSIIRCFFKENSTNEKKYEIYLDVEMIFDLWLEKNSKYYESSFSKLEKYISLNIPATLKYMIVLPDKASRKLAKIISSILNSNGMTFEENNILDIENVNKIDGNGGGIIAVISSSIVSGRNLLYLSRALRDFEKSYQRMYFTFLLRPEKKDHYEFLESNLGMGEFGKNSNRIVNVETISCSQESQTTTWHTELNFLKKLQEFCDAKGDNDATSEFCTRRIKELNNSGLERGLEDNLFFPSFGGYKLKINNGFAFAPSNKDFVKNSTQSEIYFIISSILNEIRGKGKLNQSEYVRNLIEPGNFVRFNDGIIQASILRAATADELKYHLSEEMTIQMQAVLGDMIIHLSDKHAEAINEFFFAIAIKKLRLADNVIRECIELLEKQSTYHTKNTILHGLVAFIKQRVLLEHDISTSFANILPKIQEMEK